MIYVALLRGINVGGNSKVDMKTLKSLFEDLGLQNVRTYINSGNIFFASEQKSKDLLCNKIELAIEKRFGFKVNVLIKTQTEILNISKHLPGNWLNNTEMKCDVIFLWDNINKKEILDQLTIKPGIDDVKYTDGAILWRVDRDKVTKSGLLKIIGTPIYKSSTVRNCNTFRKIKEIMASYSE